MTVSRPKGPEPGRTRKQGTKDQSAAWSGASVGRGAGCQESTGSLTSRLGETKGGFSEEAMVSRVLAAEGRPSPGGVTPGGAPGGTRQCAEGKENTAQEGTVSGVKGMRGRNLGLILRRLCLQILPPLPQAALLLG